jgi:hypothetical protein
MINKLKGKAKKAALGAQEVLLGTLRNMSPEAVGKRYEAVDQARRDRDEEMIRENFGSEENYRDTLGLDTPEGEALFTPWYAKLARAIAGARK